jgi:hypothetical protein
MSRPAEQSGRLAEATGQMGRDIADCDYRIASRYQSGQTVQIVEAVEAWSDRNRLRCFLLCLGDVGSNRTVLQTDKTNPIHRQSRGDVCHADAFAPPNASSLAFP